MEKIKKNNITIFHQLIYELYLYLSYKLINKSYHLKLNLLCYYFSFILLSDYFNIYNKLIITLNNQLNGFQQSVLRHLSNSICFKYQDLINSLNNGEYIHFKTVVFK